MSKRKLVKNQKAHKLRQEQTQALDALDSRRFSQHMPTEQAEWEKAARLHEICDTTKRTGAGGVIAGQVGLLPSGRKAQEDFINTYVNPDIPAPKKKQNMDLTKPGGRYTGRGFKVVEIPSNICILCLRSDVAPRKAECREACKCCPMMDSFVVQVKMRMLRPYDVVRSWFCAGCKNAIVKREKNDPGLQVMHEGQVVPARALEQARRYEKMWENVQKILTESRIEAQGNDAYKVKGIGEA